MNVGDTSNWLWRKFGDRASTAIDGLLAGSNRLRRSTRPVSASTPSTSNGGTRASTPDRDPIQQALTRL
jgi:hypothetical protein